MLGENYDNFSPNKQKFAVNNLPTKRMEVTKKSTLSTQLVAPNSIEKSRLAYSKLVIEKIIHMRKTKNGAIEYFCSFRNLSKIHSQWMTYEAIVSLGSINKKRVERFKESIDYFWTEGNPLFEVVYEPERILAGRPGPGYNDGDKRFEYLVKWSNLPYSLSTWDFESDINNEEIFRDFNKINCIERKKAKNPDFAIENSLSDEENIPLIMEKKYKHENELRDWQKKGVAWLIGNWKKRQGCILADEMGLGKTIQVISLIDYISSYHVNGPFLIVCPLSTLENWKREFKEWTDLNVITYQGNKKDRKIISHYEWHFWKADGAPVTTVFKFDVIICTYESVLSDERLAKIKWVLAVADEGHRLKNREAKVTKAFNGFEARMKVILTGTPIQNNVTELWTLLNFIAPKIFTDCESFKTQFEDFKEIEKAQELKNAIKPYLLRRLKKDVTEKIPPRKETIIEVELTKIQREYYKRILNLNRDALYAGDNSQNISRLINVVMQLRKVCNHPYLLENAFFEITKGQTSKEILLNKLVNSSGKFVLLSKLLQFLYKKGKKVLIFSQMKNILDLIQYYLTAMGYNFERIDGTVKGSNRQIRIDRFQKNENIFVFLLTTRAGGFGINLSRADSVIIFDSDWNPQNDLQAQSRCHRIGQVNAVQVYRLITANTYEKEMYIKASNKLNLDNAILKTLKSSNSSVIENSYLRGQDIESALKFGASNLFDDDEKGEVFKNQNIEAILKTRSVTIDHSNPFSRTLNERFSIVSENSVSDLTTRDFWEKVLPKQLTLEKTINDCEVAKPPLSLKERREIFEAIRFFVRKFLQANSNQSESSSLFFLLRLATKKNDIFDTNQRTLCEIWLNDVENPKRRRGSNYDEISYRKYMPNHLNGFKNKQLNFTQQKVLIKELINALTTGYLSFWNTLESKMNTFKRRVFGEKSKKSVSELFGHCIVLLKVFHRMCSSGPFLRILKSVKKSFEKYIRNNGCEQSADPFSCAVDTFPEIRNSIFLEHVKKHIQNWCWYVSIALRLQRCHYTDLPLGKITIPVFWWTDKDSENLIKFTVERGVENIDSAKNDKILFDSSYKFKKITRSEVQNNQNPRELICVQNIRCNCSKKDFNIGNLVKCAMCQSWCHFECFSFCAFEEKFICQKCDLPWPPKKILLQFLEAFVDLMTIKVLNEDTLIKSSQFSNQEKTEQLKNELNILKHRLLTFGLMYLETFADKALLKKFLTQCVYFYLKSEYDYECKLQKLGKKKALANRKKYFATKSKQFRNLCVCRKFAGDKKMSFCTICGKWFHSDCVKMGHQTEHFSKFVCSECSSLAKPKQLARKAKQLFKKALLLEDFQFGFVKGVRSPCLQPMNKDGEVFEVCHLILSELKLKLPDEILKTIDLEFCSFTSLHTIERNLESGCYPTPNHYAEDVRLFLRDLWKVLDGTKETQDVRKNLLECTKEFECNLLKTLPRHQAGPSSTENNEHSEVICKPVDLPEELIVDLNITVAQASKIVERVELFQRVEFAISLGINVLKTLIAFCAVIPPPTDSNPTGNEESFDYETKMPSWWDPPLHDLSVVDGISRHGFGAVETIISDIHFKPAISSTEGFLENAKVSFFMEFLVDSFVLARRLQYVCDVVLNEVYHPRPVAVVYLEDCQTLQKAIMSFYDKVSLLSASRRLEQRKKRRSLVDATKTSQESVKKAKANPDTTSPPFEIKGGISVLSLGEIVTGHRINFFHSHRNIFPTGFVSERKYIDCLDPISEEQITYRSAIVDNGGDFPIFEVTAPKYPKLVFTAATSTGVWNNVIAKIKEKRADLGKTKINGHEIFGYSHKKIKSLIEKLPGAEYCVKYWAKVNL